MWIKIEDALPIQNFVVKVRNGTKIYEAKYYRKKWTSFGRQLHKVTEWYKCPVVYPKVLPKEWRKFLERAESYKNQMQKRNFITRPISLE